MFSGKKESADAKSSGTGILKLQLKFSDAKDEMLSKSQSEPVSPFQLDPTEPQKKDPRVTPVSPVFAVSPVSPVRQGAAAAMDKPQASAKPPKIPATARPARAITTLLRLSGASTPYPATVDVKEAVCPILTLSASYKAKLKSAVNQEKNSAAAAVDNKLTTGVPVVKPQRRIEFFTFDLSAIPHSTQSRSARLSSENAILEYTVANATM